MRRVITIMMHFRVQEASAGRMRMMEELRHRRFIRESMIMVARV